MALEEDFAVQDIDRLIAIYARARRDIVQSLIRGRPTAFKLVRGKELLAQVDATIEDLRQASEAWLKSRLPKFYQAGMRLQADASGLPMPTLSGIHRQAIGKIAADIERHLTLNVLPSVATSAGRAFRQARQTIVAHERLMERLGVSQIRGLTVKDLARDIAQTLQDGATERLKAGGVDAATRERLKEVAEGRLIRIVGKDGKERTYGLQAYSRIIARTSSRMAHSEGIIQTAKELGEDLVQISVHARACPRCLPLQGRVFSITGKNPDFPLLGEANRPPIHPNCAHVLLPAPEAFLRRRGLYDGLSRWSREGRSIDTAADYQRLLQEIRAAGKVPKPPKVPKEPRPPKAPKVPKEPPPWKPPGTAEGILLDPGQLDRLVEAWEEVGGQAARRRPFGQRMKASIVRVVVRTDAVRKHFAGVYDDAGGGEVGLAPKVKAELDALVNATKLRRRVWTSIRYLGTQSRQDVEMILGVPPGSFGSTAFDAALDKASLPQLQALALRNVGRTREAFKTLVHESAHGTQAIPVPSYGWRGYSYDSAASAWQEAATELWARVSFNQAADALLPGLKAARKGLSLYDPIAGSYANQVKALRGVMTLAGYSPAEAMQTLTELKFNTAVHRRITFLGNTMAERWKVTDLDVRGEIVEALHAGLGVLSEDRNAACYRLSDKLQRILLEAARQGKATKPPAIYTPAI